MQHKFIPDGEIHEPKGISTTTPNKAYFSNGSGSGTWRKVGSADLEGLSGDGGSADKVFLTNGSGQFRLSQYASYGSVYSNNRFTASITTAGANEFPYGSVQPLSDGGYNWYATSNNDGLSFQVSGYYQYGFSYKAEHTSDPTADVYVKLLKNNSVSIIPEQGIYYFDSGDSIRVALVSSVIGSVDMGRFSLYVNLVRAV